MSDDDFRYFQRRERQERIAAKAAPTLGARRAHQEMALRYSVLLMWGDPAQLAA
ncbi:hypothetical protein G7077_04865 [Sphingomonas piscis]|uniref:Uncharacterized protein n=1 Tax=Sphingomonas piscis TaxID=2714943 RepID=A0A6G7YNL5_9SPHN|nr:hypothetical protein [Sphingomonas piscis]QIK78332.1 hypothetical protein G7077_04865 [Sphingomonas piscis]